MSQHLYTKRALGASGLHASAIGVGTNRWGAGGVDTNALTATFQASLDAGVDFFDTAEVYNRGKSERLVGERRRSDPRPVLVASKFAPLPARLTKSQLGKALDASLQRMGLDAIDLYYLHFPFSLVSISTWMEAMSEPVHAGKVRAVGISNCNARQMHTAFAALAQHGVPLAANQVHYSLLHRKPEDNGVLEACAELDVALVAYRPLESGALSTEEAASAKNRQLGETMKRIADQRGASIGQVGLTWLLQRSEHVVAIPGATKGPHAMDNAGALTWKLTEGEFDELDRVSRSPK